MTGLPNTNMTTAYSPAGERREETPDSWPFGRLTELQQRRREEQLAAIRRIEAKRHAERVAAALRSYEEALL